MAEEVEIVGVDGGPASEATLKKLLAAMQKTANGTSSSAKVQQQYNQALKQGTKILDEFGNELEDASGHLASFGQALTGALGMVYNGLKGIISGTVNTFESLIAAFNDGNGTLTDFVEVIPFVGGMLSRLTGIFDDTYDTFQSLSTVGASFNNDLLNLRNSAAAAYLSLDDFAGFVVANTDKLAALGGSVTKGATTVGQLNKELGDQRDQLQAMGLTFEEINETLVDYAYLTRVQGLIDQRSNKEIAERAAEYAKTLSTLSKLTGEDVKTLREKNRANQTDLAYQLKLSRLSADAQDKANSGLLKMQTLAGDTFAARFKEMMSNFPAVTRETALLASTMPTAEAALREYTDAVKNGTLTEEKEREIISKMLAGTLADAKKMEGVITAGALTGEGIGAEISRIFEDLGMDTSKLINMTFAEAAREIEKEMERTAKETKARNELTTSLGTFREMVKKVKEAFEQNVILPLGTALGPALLTFTESLNGMVSAMIDDVDKQGLVNAVKKWLVEVVNVIANGFNTVLFGSKKTIGHPSGGSASTGDTGIASGALSSFFPNAEIKDFTDLLENLTTFVNEKIASAKDMMIGAGAGLAAIAAGVVLIGKAGPSAAVGTTSVLPFLLGLSALFATGGMLASGVSKLIDSFSKSFGNIADGIIKFQNLDGQKLLSVGSSITGFLDPLGDIIKQGFWSNFGGASALNSIADGIKEFNKVDAGNLKAVTTELREFKYLSDGNFELDDSNIVTFTESVNELTEALDKLNDELKQDNSSWFGNKKASAGSLLSGINGSNASSDSNNDLKSLNTTMMQIVKLLEKNQQQNSDIINGLKKVRGEL